MINRGFAHEMNSYALLHKCNNLIGHSGTAGILQLNGTSWVYYLSVTICQMMCNLLDPV